MGNGFLLGQTGGSVASGDNGWIYDLNAYDLYESLYAAVSGNVIVDITGEGFLLGACAWALSGYYVNGTIKLTIDGGTPIIKEQFTSPIYFATSLKIESFHSLFPGNITPASYSYLLKKASPKPSVNNNVFAASSTIARLNFTTSDKTLLNVTGAGYLSDINFFYKTSSGNNKLLITITIDGTTLVTAGKLRALTSSAVLGARMSGLYRFNTSVLIKGYYFGGASANSCIEYYLD